jgi:hypothetical protein
VEEGLCGVGGGESPALEGVEEGERVAALGDVALDGHFEEYAYEREIGADVVAGVEVLEERYCPRNTNGEWDFGCRGTKLLACLNHYRDEAPLSSFAPFSSPYFNSTSRHVKMPTMCIYKERQLTSHI